MPDSADQFTDKTPALYREGYEYYRTPRAQHIDLYDKPQFVTPSVAKLKEFFGKALH